VEYAESACVRADGVAMSNGLMDTEDMSAFDEATGW